MNGDAPREAEAAVEEDSGVVVAGALAVPADRAAEASDRANYLRSGRLI